MTLAFIFFTTLFPLTTSAMEMGTIKDSKREVELIETRIAIPDCSATELIQEIPALKEYVRDLELEKIKAFKSKLLSLQEPDKKAVHEQFPWRYFRDLEEITEKHEASHISANKKMAKKAGVVFTASMLSGIAMALSGGLTNDEKLRFTGVGAMSGSAFIGLGMMILPPSQSIESKMRNELYEIEISKPTD